MMKCEVLSQAFWLTLPTDVPGFWPHQPCLVCLSQIDTNVPLSMTPSERSWQGDPPQWILCEYRSHVTGSEGFAKPVSQPSPWFFWGRRDADRELGREKVMSQSWAIFAPNVSGLCPTEPSFRPAWLSSYPFGSWAEPPTWPLSWLGTLYRMPATVLSSCDVISSSQQPWRSRYSWSHFTDEETEARTGHLTCAKWLDQNFIARKIERIFVHSLTHSTNIYWVPLGCWSKWIWSPCFPKLMFQTLGLDLQESTGVCPEAGRYRHHMPPWIRLASSSDIWRFMFSFWASVPQSITLSGIRGCQRPALKSSGVILPPI